MSNLIGEEKNNENINENNLKVHCRNNKLKS